MVHFGPFCVPMDKRNRNNEEHNSQNVSHAQWHPLKCPWVLLRHHATIDFLANF